MTNLKSSFNILFIAIIIMIVVFYNIAIDLIRILEFCLKCLCKILMKANCSIHIFLKKRLECFFRINTKVSGAKHKILEEKNDRNKNISNLKSTNKKKLTKLKK
ncbi:hypothetical protein MHBO_004174 [Bonamia ostreae]|uniref:ATP synthase F0 subunit 8 n=1 Tax=Bonamia ostreae TaxID=126728 RepID=A0ABV2ASL3_9EUKA